MVKRTTAYVFVILASALLLAHAVIPHHHHQQQICFNQSHCRGNHAVHQHNATEPGHRHDGDNSGNCTLIQAAVLPSDQAGSECDCYDTPGSHSHDCLVIFSNNEAEVLHSGFCNVAPISDFFYAYASFVAASIGLRAPPIV